MTSDTRKILFDNFKDMQQQNKIFPQIKSNDERQQAATQAVKLVQD